MVQANLYEKVDINGEIRFVPYDVSRVTICGKTVPEIETILNGLEIEKLTKIPLTMENLDRYKTLIGNEIQKSYEKAITDIVERGFNNDKKIL